MAKALQPAALKPAPKVAASAAPVRQPPTAKKKTGGKPEKKDNFSELLVVATVSVLTLSAVGYFYLHAAPRYESKQNYQVLPQLVYENEGQVMQLQVNIQVNEKDRNWLEKNSGAVNGIFVKTVQQIDPETFRTKEGSEAVLVQLKNSINMQLNTSKVEAVLYKDMVIQHQVD